MSSFQIEISNLITNWNATPLNIKAGVLLVFFSFFQLLLIGELMGDFIDWFVERIWK